MLRRLANAAFSVVAQTNQPPAPLPEARTWIEDRQVLDGRFERGKYVINVAPSIISLSHTEGAHDSLVYPNVHRAILRQNAIVIATAHDAVVQEASRVPENRSPSAYYGEIRMVLTRMVVINLLTGAKIERDWIAPNTVELTIDGRKFRYALRRNQAEVIEEATP